MIWQPSKQRQENSLQSLVHKALTCTRAEIITSNSILLSFSAFVVTIPLWTPTRFNTKRVIGEAINNSLAGAMDMLTSPYSPAKKKGTVWFWGWNLNILSRAFLAAPATASFVFLSHFFPNPTYPSGQVTATMAFLLYSPAEPIFMVLSVVSTRFFTSLSSISGSLIGSLLASSSSIVRILPLFTNRPVLVFGIHDFSITTILKNLYHHSDACIYERFSSSIGTFRRKNKTFAAITELKFESNHK